MSKISRAQLTSSIDEMLENRKERKFEETIEL